MIYYEKSRLNGTTGKIQTYIIQLSTMRLGNAAITVA